MNWGLQSWINVQNSNPFCTTLKEEKDYHENQKSQGKSVDESFIRQEESQILKNLSQINNLMESNNVVILH